MNLSEKRIDGQTLYAGKIVNVRIDRIELPTGKLATREVVEHPGGVCGSAAGGGRERRDGPAMALSVYGGAFWRSPRASCRRMNRITTAGCASLRRRPA